MKRKSSFNNLKLVALIFFISIFQQSYSQYNRNTRNERFIADFNERNSKSILNKGFKLNDIKGSPYLLDEFTLGTVITSDNFEYSDIPLRYNIYNDEIEFISKGNSIFAFGNPEIIKEIQLGEDVFVYCKSNNKGGFYSLKYSGKVQLLSKYCISLEEATPAGLYKKSNPQHFQKKPNIFYIRTEENKLAQIYNKKDLESIFGAKSKEMLTYIKKEKIKLRKEKGLIKLVKFINQMD